MKRILLVAVAVLTSLALPAGPAARAEEQPHRPDRTAWWFELQQVPGLTIPAIAAIPEGGMVVQHLLAFETPPLLDTLPAGFLSGTTAYGAVHYTVDPGSTGTFRMDTAVGSTALAAQLRACPTVSAWNADPPPGPWFSKPSYDEPCSAGVVSADGMHVTFDVTREQTPDGVLDYAIVPAADALPFVVIFAKVADDALRVTAPEPGVPLPPLVPVVDDATAPGVPTGGPPTDLGPVAAPASPSTPLPAVVPPLATVGASEPVRGGAGAAAALGILALGWVGLTRRRTREPRSLLD